MPNHDPDHPLGNSEAGNHPLPGDPREVQAALRAGQECWARFPYYGLRYGDRGERFTRSDSGYLAALAAEPEPVVLEQVLWLGNVLASRGMPTWLLESHLDLLHRALAAAAPERAERYLKLERAAATLRLRRLGQVSAQRVADLAADFRARVGAEPWAARLPEAGELLVAAVADERGGTAHAVPSLLSWFADPARFSPTWIAAGAAVIEAARTPR